MLKEIICDKFNEKSIVFSSGLNVVLGDSNATNSIGKSMMLMIIDFVFGGDSYIKCNYDAVEKLGHHEFKIEFKFEESYYFIRNTQEYKFVYVADDKFNIIKKIQIGEYTALLKEKYEISIIETSFREIVGRYARIWGKENLEIGKPIQYFHKETKKSSLTSLIKLFDKYKLIKSFETQIEELVDRKRVINEAAKQDFIPKMTKKLFKENEKNIEELRKQIDEIKNNIIDISNEIESLVTKEIIELRKEKSQLLKQKLIYENRLERTKNNINLKITSESYEFTKLEEYFPNINIKKLNEVENFHRSITGILKEELRESEKESKNQIEFILTKIIKIDEEMASKLNIKDVPKLAVDKIVEISTNINRMTNENSYYSKKEEIETHINDAKKDLAEIKSNILIDISSQINSVMDILNKEIYKDERRAPILSLSEDNYVFKTFSDTGTGTAYANLITFDLAIVNLTEIPCIVHDLPLFKNIETPAMQNIIRIYNTYKKQIFIAIDEIDKYNDEVTKLLLDKAVVKLTKERTLFTVNWKRENKTK